MKIRIDMSQQEITTLLPIINSITAYSNVGDEPSTFAGEITTPNLRTRLSARMSDKGEIYTAECQIRPVVVKCIAHGLELTKGYMSHMTDLVTDLCDLSRPRGKEEYMITLYGTKTSRIKCDSFQSLCDSVDMTKPVLIDDITLNGKSILKVTYPNGCKVRTLTDSKGNIVARL